MLSVMNTNKYKVSQRTNKAHTETVHNERHDLTHSRLLANFDRQIPRSANDLIILFLFYSHYFGTGFNFFVFFTVQMQVTNGNDVTLLCPAAACIQSDYL